MNGPDACNGNGRVLSEQKLVWTVQLQLKKHWQRIS